MTSTNNTVASLPAKLIEKVCAEIARRSGLAWPDDYDADEQKEARESVGGVLKIAASIAAHENGGLPILPDLPKCWSGSPVTVTWAEDGETTTREVWSEPQVQKFAYDYGEQCFAAGRALASPAIPAIPPGYDRELIARMLFDYSNISGGRYEALSARKQAQLISEADNATGEAVTVNRSGGGEGGKE